MYVLNVHSIRFSNWGKVETQTRKAVVLTLNIFLFIVLSSSYALASGSGIENQSSTSQLDKPLTETPIISLEKEIVSNSTATDITNVERKNGILKSFLEEILSSWRKDLFWALMATFFAYSLVIITDKLKEPNIVFAIGSGDINQMEGQSKKHKFIHIKITNYDKKFSFLEDFLPTTMVAFSTKATIIIRDDGKQRVFIGRWSNHPQLLPKMLQTEQGTIGIPDVNALIHSREDVHPQPKKGKSELCEDKEVVIGLKYEGEEDFYLFNNESYIDIFKEYKNDKSKFSKGTYEGTLVLSTLGLRKVQSFKIYNTSSKLEDFRVELL